MTATAVSGSATRQARPWLILVGCFLLSAGLNAFVIAPSSIVPLFIERFDITKAAAGNIISAAVVGAIITQIPGGYLLDRYDNRVLLGGAVGVYIAVVLLIQVVDGYTPFLGLRVVGGMTAGFVFTAGANVVGEVFPLAQQDLATGIYITSAPASFALAHATGPLLSTRYGPLTVFLFHAAVTVVGLVVFWLAVADPVRTGETPTLAEFTRALGNRALILVALSSFAMYSLYLFLNMWIPTYGSEVLSLSLSQAGFVTAIVPLAGIVARPTGGWLSGYLGGRRRLVVGGGLFGALVFMTALQFAANLVAFLLLLAAAAFTLQLGVGLYYVITRELSAAGTEGTSLTVLTAIGFTGSFVAPIAGGRIIAAYSWPAAFVTFAAVGGLGVLVLIPVGGR